MLGGVRFFYSNRPQNNVKGLEMQGEFYRSYRSYAMFPITIHCSGMKYKEATILSAGFAAFGCDSWKVSAYITLKNGNPDLAKELLEILDLNGNFIRTNHDNGSIYNPLIS